jgi:hypothetical protein
MSDVILKGNITSSYQTQVSPIAYAVNNFLITNKTGGTVTLNVQISDGNQIINIAPKDLQLALGTSYGDFGYAIQPEEYLIITVSGSCDYYIDLTPIS